MNIKKAILTGGGRATRLRPITETRNKHLLPLANKPMIDHAIEKVVKAGITDIIINTNPGDTELAAYVGDGSRWGVHISYFEQTGGPQGIAHVVNLAKDFIGDDPFLFYLSDNILLGDIDGFVQDFASGNYDCMLALSQVEDASRFGVPFFREDGTLEKVVEKPQNPPNNFAVTGIYLYGPKIFFEAFENITPSDRGEYEISDIHTVFLQEGKNVGYKEITGWWKDTGKPQDLLIANQLLLKQCDTSVMQGKHIEQKGNVVINEPVVIGDNVVLEDCTIGPDVTIGEGSVIKRATISNSVLLDHVTVDLDTHISDSLIGKSATLVEQQSDEKTGVSMIVGDKTYLQL